MKCLLTSLLVLFITTTHAQKATISSLSDFIRECTKANSDGENKQAVIWYPYNFWEASFDQKDSSDKELWGEMVTILKQYYLFYVLDYTSSDTVGHFKSREEILPTLQLTDSANNILKPLDDNDLSPDVQDLLKKFVQPFLAQRIGAFGKGMNLFLFQAAQVNDEPVFNVTAKNSIVLSWSDKHFNWKLPFTSTLPLKYCPIDKEQMKVNWEYCPIHGVKLN